ncbi:dehydrogenase/reductase SDR family member 11-like [Amphibalanus amphitrite]|uniref:dehydrogenase/reductase SDR family member 11-like n=1 Tax=Amphibalanus amphitrite TaxID=1232801 RepID=UPI001C927164|nr:dehydrogenase/reductase SDR family member 11-like [Amphibalanus amphitrite]
MERYQGRVAVVTGVSSGIGEGLVRALVAAGIRVAGCARNADKLQTLKESLGPDSEHFLPVTCDLTEEQQVRNFFERVLAEWGAVDILINNAGLAFNSSLLDGTVEEWRTMLDTNIVALCLCTQLTVESMKESNISDGYIIHINSESGHMHPVPSKFHFYSATKHAVRALTETMRLELAKTLPGCRISSVSPGLVETQFLAKMAGRPAEQLKVFSRMKALEVEDVVQTVLHLLRTPAHVQVHDVLMRPAGQTS